jgi:hypothetical protein
MKSLKAFGYIFLFFISSFFFACGGGGEGGSSTDTGSVAMSVTDAKPLLPENVSNVFVTFSEVWVHKSGEGWIQLDLVETPYTIDLYQFNDGNTTELVPPSILSAGEYTQVRIVVSEAAITFDNGGSTEDVTLEIPSGNLKTDKNFTINVGDESAMDIVIHFDLSMSVIVSGSPSNRKYSLKPVMHLFQDPLQAATLQGKIDYSFFGDHEKVTIVVLADNIENGNQEEFTKVEVSRSADQTPTEFSIYWLVPNKSYEVRIDLNIETDNPDGECNETVTGDDLGPGETYDLNGGEAITGPDSNGACL